MSDKFLKTVQDQLLGRRIVQIRYLTTQEAQDIGWDYKCIVFILDDGEYLFPSSDDEGNNAGAMFTSYEDFPTIGVER